LYNYKARILNIKQTIIFKKKVSTNLEKDRLKIATLDRVLFPSKVPKVVNKNVLKNKQTSFLNDLHFISKINTNTQPQQFSMSISLSLR